MRSVLAAGAAVLVVLGVPATAHADQTVVVPGTSFPSGGTYLTYFGCTDLYHADTRGPEVRVRRDDQAPVGRRYTSLAMPGAGTASGPVSLVDSVATATSSIAVDAALGSEGVAYVWFVSSALEEGEVWAGRAPLTTTGDGWQQVDAGAASYEWSRLDAATGTILEELDVATMADFAAEHGDGPGYLLAGFGCDGGGFGIDDVRVGTPGAVTTYDLEGWSVSTSIASGQEQVAPGDEVRVTGMSVDPWERVMGAPLVLEARPAGAAAFEPVTGPLAAAADGTVVATVTPRVTTEYRWAFAETAYADAHRSAPVRVEVADPAAEEPPESTETPTLPPPAAPEVNVPKPGKGTQEKQDEPDKQESPQRDPQEQTTTAPEPEDPPSDAVSEEPTPEEPPPGE